MHSRPKLHFNCRVVIWYRSLNTDTAIWRHFRQVFIKHYLHFRNEGPKLPISPLPWKRLYLDFWVHYFHKSHIPNERPLIQNMMFVNSKWPKTFEIFTQMSDFVFFPMVPPLHICWNTDGRLIESSVLFYTILPCFTM